MRNFLKPALFATLLILGPLLLLVVSMELVLRAAGFGYATTPLVRMEVDGDPAWVGNPDFTRLFFPNNLKRLPPPVRIPVEKDPGTLRLMIVGGSAAAGDPDTDFSIARNLQWILSSTLPDRQVEVINLAYTACNSHVAREVVRQSGAYELDGIIVLVGNNEVIGPFGPGTTLTESLPSLGKRDWQLRLRKTKLGQLGQAFNEALRKNSSETAWRGMQHFLDHRIAIDDPRLEQVYLNFSVNLEDMEAEARRQDIPVLLATVPVNLLDQPPFHGDLDSIPEGLRQDILTYLETGATSRTLASWESAAEEFPLSSNLHYIVGNLLFEDGQASRADAFLKSARDLDQLRFRADSRINSTIRHQWSRDDARWIPVDAELPLIEDNPRQVLGFPHFYEHVHFSFRANFLIARQIARSFLENESLDTDALDSIDWQQAATALAYSPFEAWKILSEINRRFAQPPFSEIPGYARKVAWMEDLRQQLDAYISKAESKAAMQQTYLAAIDSRPGDDRIQVNLAQFYIAFERPAAAFPLLEDAFRRNPTDTDLANDFFNLCLTLQKSREAREALQRIETVFPESPQIPSFRERLADLAD